MAITQLQKDVTRSLRQYGKTINAEVRFRSINAKSQYVEIHIKSIDRPTPDGLRSAFYPDTFKLEDRVKALKIIYGENCDFAARGNSGNICPHSMTMHAHEWARFFEGTPFAVQVTEVSHVG